MSDTNSPQCSPQPSPPNTELSPDAAAATGTATSTTDSKGANPSQRQQRFHRRRKQDDDQDHTKKKGAAVPTPTKANMPSPPPPMKRIKEDAFLCVHLAVSGRSPVNGWIMSIGAVIIAAKRRAVLAAMERHCLPLHTSLVTPAHPCSYAPVCTFDTLAAAVTPAADVAGFWRTRRTDLEYLSRAPVPAAQAFAELQALCAPYAALTLVANPLLSVYGWLSYYWTALFQGEGGDGGATAAAMPWGFSGLCARSFACGLLGCPPKALGAHPVYRTSFQGFDNSGSVLPLGDALTTAVSFSYLHALAQSRAAAAKDGKEHEMEVPIPAVQVECTLPPLLTALQCVPPCTINSSSSNTTKDNAAHPSTSAADKKQLLFDYVIDARIRDGFAHHSSHHADGPPPTGQPFVEYPSITDIQQHCAFLTTLEEVLATPTTSSTTAETAERTKESAAAVPWVATEKVHGSNFTIYTDGAEVWAGKRTGYLALADSPSFFDFVYLLESQKETILAVYEGVLAWLAAQEVQHGGTGCRTGGEDGGLVVSIICELAGGAYPHPRVPPDLRGVVVQRGVYYAPFNFFYGFDVAVEAAAMARCVPHYHGALLARGRRVERAAGDVVELSFIGKDGRYYLPYHTTCALFTAAHFAHASILLSQRVATTTTTSTEPETLRQFLARADPEQLNSHVAEGLWGLPPLPDNKAEGYVVRPEEDLWIGCHSNESNHNNNSNNTTWSRAIIKQKHPRFAEFMRTPGTATTTTTPPTSGAVTEVDFLTAARVESVLSKYKAEEQRDRAAMVAAVLADARKDAERFLNEQSQNRKS